MPSVFAWTLLAFLSGSLPFSLWIGRLALKTDIRTYGDHNPGATNVLRAGGKGAAALALALDMLKGAAPVALAASVGGLYGWSLVPVAIAPVAGHAFSPFLGFRGGKAVAVTGGVWAALTAWEGPTIGGLLLGLFVPFTGANGRAVLLAMTGMLAWLWFTPPAWNGLVTQPPRAVMPAVWLGQMSIIMWKHRADFRREG
ncbi:MAG: glycerol-3-phosphate acyltransferase [Caldilineaceae bacterium]|nr:glycerol-3-phosphate acyltransferase [Caldilineaceae bacterium]